MSESEASPLKFKISVDDSYVHKYFQAKLQQSCILTNLVDAKGIEPN